MLNLSGVPQRVRKLLPAHHQKIVQTNCEKVEFILSTCRPRLRTAEAGTSTQTRRSTSSCSESTSASKKNPTALARPACHNSDLNERQLADSALEELIFVKHRVEAEPMLIQESRARALGVRVSFFETGSLTGPSNRFACGLFA